MLGTEEGFLVTPGQAALLGMTEDGNENHGTGGADVDVQGVRNSVN